MIVFTSAKGYPTVLRQRSSSRGFWQLDENNFILVLNPFQNTYNHNLRSNPHNKNYGNLTLMKGRGGSEGLIINKKGQKLDLLDQKYVLFSGAFGVPPMPP